MLLLQLIKMYSLLPSLLFTNLLQKFLSLILKQKESKMKNRCPLCEGNKTEGTITYTVDLGFGVVVVRGVPAKICTQCGEEWIDASVARSLETIVLSAKAKHSPVEVVGYH